MSTPVERDAERARKKIQENPELESVIIHELWRAIAKKTSEDLSSRILRGLGFELDEEDSAPTGGAYPSSSTSRFRPQGEVWRGIESLFSHSPCVKLSSVSEEDQKILEKNDDLVQFLIQLRCYTPKRLRTIYTHISSRRLYQVQEILIKYNVMEKYTWRGRSRKSYPVMVYHVMDASQQDIDAWMQHYYDLDLMWIEEEKRKYLPPEEILDAIKEGERLRKIAQKEGIAAANATVQSVKYRDPAIQQLKQEVAKSEIQIQMQDMPKVHTCSKNCDRDQNGVCLLVKHKEYETLKKKVKIGKTLLRNADVIPNLDVQLSKITNPKISNRGTLRLEKRDVNANRKRELIRIIEQKQYTLVSAVVDRVLDEVPYRGHSLFAYYVKEVEK